MRKLLLVMLSAIIMLVFVACGNKVDESTTEKFTTKAEDIVLLLNDANYEDVHAMFDEQMKVALPVHDMEQLTPVFEESGDFKEINKSSIEEDEDFYVAVLAAKYSEKNRVFTISFNAEEEVVGLYVK